MYKDTVNYWYKHKKDSEDDYLRLLNKFWLLQTYSSNNIESGNLNYNITRAVFDDSEITADKIFAKDIVEANNSRIVRSKIISSLMNSEVITPEFIKRIHKTYMYGLYSNTRLSKGERPGIFKIGDYCVGLTSEGSLPENVDSDITELCDEVSSVDEFKVLETAAYFHLKFEVIHPFADGNGRVGRLLMNYLLMLSNHPPVNIFKEDKETYYMALEVFDRTGEISGFVRFLQEQCVKTWEDVIKSQRKTSLSDAVYKMNG